MPGVSVALTVVFLPAIRLIIVSITKFPFLEISRWY
ncbi:hypothetical protein MEC_01345 [Bartonella alsatica IBS 382]|uniref:Uncharacterized protein n=1 Tax=Bartonella alsatica IBS 382 TaxID=1094551 RepID=J0PVG6_9HYPH|nr:hypothetical protein MEC_01345 [Bartonella alsatica IBS 382]